MSVFIGSDHGGFELKQYLIGRLSEKGYAVSDCGSYSSESTDYPDFALAVGKAVNEEKGSFGILVCRSGEGMEMAANKIRGIRAALIWQPAVAQESRRDNDANVAALPADYLGKEEAAACAETFLGTAFSGEARHIRRLEKLHSIEHAVYEG